MERMASRAHLCLIIESFFRPGNLRKSLKVNSQWAFRIQDFPIFQLKRIYPQAKLSLGVITLKKCLRITAQQLLHLLHKRARQFSLRLFFHNLLISKAPAGIPTDALF